MTRKKMGIGKVLLIEALVIILGLIVTLYITLKDMTQLNLFIDFPNLIIILLFVIPEFLSSGLQKDFLLIFKIQKKPVTISQLRRCLESVLLMQRLILIGGLFSTFVALITCLTHLSNLSVLGPNIAVICLSGFYTVILEFLLLPFKTYVQLTLIEEMEIDNEEK